jgi:hypothetical protein
MGFFSSLSNFVSSTVSAVRNTAQRVWDKTKEVAANALGWMAEKAEAFVGSTKRVWKNIKPFIDSHIKPVNSFLKVVLSPWPWLAKLLHVLEVTIDAVVLFERTILAKKLEEAIHWTIRVARNLRDSILSTAIQAEARVRKAIFKEAIALLPPERRRVIHLADMVSTFIVVQAEIQKQLDSNAIKDFETYLRLRATQKLLGSAQERLGRATEIDQISDDDIFLLDVGDKLIGPAPTLLDEDAKRLDGIVRTRCGKSLLSFVFEELVMAWWQNLAKFKEELKSKTDSLAKETIQLRLLTLEEKSLDISEHEKARLLDLRSAVPTLRAEEERLAKKVREMSSYVFASEGLLQTVEKSPEELEAEDRDYLKEEAALVGKIIIDCAQNGKDWDTLTGDERALITDYANIFKEASETRAKQLVTVEIMG